MEEHDKVESPDRPLTMAEILRPKIQRDKPSIDHLEDLVRLNGEGQPSLDIQVGDRIVIERYSGLLKDRPWLDTKPYYVNGVNQETGKIHLFFEELQQHATDNFILGLQLGNKYRRVPQNGRWDSPPRLVRKLTPVPTEAAAGPTGVEGDTIKKGRGRPKGSKNRDKDVIEAEKKERAEARLAKRARRS